MRQVKFKAKRIDNGVWIEGSVIVTTHQTLISQVKFMPALSIPTSNFIETNPDTLCQYIKTVGDVEVWEGDVFVTNTELTRRIESVVTWIDEWCLYALLVNEPEHCEYRDYLSKGITALDYASYWGYTLEDLPNHTKTGNIHD